MEKKYGLVTALSMVIGIVIGSGIFFKADDILSATGGNAYWGILGFIIVGVGTLFGALVISRYAMMNDAEGGLVTYATEALGRKFGYLVGWFIITISMPAIIAILGFVSGIYLQDLLGIQSENFLLIASFLLITLAITVNVLDPKLGGIIQSGSTFIKLIPLVLVGIIGLFFGEPSTTENVPTEIVMNANFFASLIAIAFAFDGWIFATSISGEVVDAKKNLPKALGLGLSIIVGVYVIYFYGITKLMDPAEIISLGDAHVSAIAVNLFGTIGGKLLTLFVLISVYGALNGMVLGCLRMPKALVSQGLMKDFAGLGNVNENTGISTGAIAFTAIWSFGFLAVHFLTINGVIFSNLATEFDISSVPVTINYILYNILYICVFKVSDDNSLKLKLYVVLAILTSCLVIYGALQVNGLLYIIISTIIILSGLFFYENPNKI